MVCQQGFPHVRHTTASRAEQGQYMIYDGHKKKKHLSTKSGNAPIILYDPVLGEILWQNATGDQLPSSLLPTLAWG